MLALDDGTNSNYVTKPIDPTEGLKDSRNSGSGSARPQLQSRSTRLRD